MVVAVVVGEVVGVVVVVEVGILEILVTVEVVVVEVLLAAVEEVIVEMVVLVVLVVAGDRPSTTQHSTARHAHTLSAPLPGKLEGIAPRLGRQHAPLSDHVHGVGQSALPQHHLAVPGQ
jgi:hypothetical protein